MKKLYIIFAILILLTPLGLIAQGTAWGEWGLSKIKNMIGFVPQGMGKFSGLVKSIMPDYGIAGFNNNFIESAIGYIFSAIIGIGLILLIFAILRRFMGKNA